MFFFTFGQKGGGVLPNPKNSYQKKNEVVKKGGGGVSAFLLKVKKSFFYASPYPLCHACYQTSDNQKHQPGINWLVGTLFIYVTSNNQNHQPGINWLICSLPASVTTHTKQLRSILCRPVEKHTEDLVIIEEMTKNV